MNSWNQTSFILCVLLIVCLSCNPPNNSKIVLDNAMKGDLKAQVSLGLMHLNGDGAKKDYLEAEKWFPLYNKIQKAGKNLVIDSSPFGVDHLYKNLDPRGLYVKTYTVSRALSKIYLPKFMGGWGAPFRKSFTKISEDYMVVKNKFRLKVMNKLT